MLSQFPCLLDWYNLEFRITWYWLLKIFWKQQLSNCSSKSCLLPPPKGVAKIRALHFCVWFPLTLPVQKVTKHSLGLKSIERRHIIGSDESWPRQFSHFTEKYLDKWYCFQMLTLCNRLTPWGSIKIFTSRLINKKVHLYHYFQWDVIVKMGHIPLNLHFTSFSKVTQNCDESNFYIKL